MLTAMHKIEVKKANVRKLSKKDGSGDFCTAYGTVIYKDGEKWKRHKVSRYIYEKSYNNFMDWCSKNNVGDDDYVMIDMVGTVYPVVNAEGKETELKFAPTWALGLKNAKVVEKRDFDNKPKPEEGKNTTASSNQTEEPEEIVDDFEDFPW